MRSIQTQIAHEDWFHDDKIKNVFFPELRKNLEGGAPWHFQYLDIRLQGERPTFVPGQKSLMSPYRSADAAKTFPIADGNSLE